MSNIDRTIHKKPDNFFEKYPVGGLFLYLTFIISYIFLNPVDTPVYHLYSGLTLIYLVGLIDDYKDLNFKLKLLFQLMAIFYLVYFGVKVNFITNPVEGFIYLEELSIPVTILWIFTLVNLINLLVGIRDLIYGITIIPTIFVALIAWDLGRNLSAALALILVISLLLLKIVNKYFKKNWELGNSGSMLTGAILAIISISGAVKSITFLSLLLPLMVMGVPVLNGLIGLIIIFIKKKRLTQLRTKLLHHLLLDWGLTEKQSRMAFYLLSLLFGVVSFLLIKVTRAQSLIIIAILLFFLVIGLQELRRGIFKKEELKNVKLLKDIQLNLYQIKDIIKMRTINGDLKIISQELNDLQKVISVKIPDYMKNVYEETSAVSEKESDINVQVTNMIDLIDEVITNYSMELDNLDFILNEYKGELEETVEYLDNLYLRLK